MQIQFGDDKYELTGPEFEVMFDYGQQASFVSIQPIKVTVLCEHCGNTRVERMELHSIQELIDNGWITPVATPPEE